VELPHLSEGHQQWEVDLVSVSQDLKDPIQVDLVFTEAPWEKKSNTSLISFFF